MEPRRKRKTVKALEISRMRTSKNIVVNEDTFVDFNPLDVLPEVIDKDHGFFLMFGHPDNPLDGQTSDNFSYPRKAQLA